ncbi:hypothetical protein EKO27_g4652 [Xylaria grammica]|uniref:Malonyl-CoA:ACP transacylase (MAT) domain-containing protein n=1 Tax=Xylaria grammica TaxID=363999 RepID=A0A439D7U6_9PEZI|nr:hypothetical protein EKO27_g4652 [Xylaria grammica]
MSTRYCAESRVFGGYFKPSSPLHIGSLKANVGHSGSAAGVSSVIKGALILKNGVIPPQAVITSTAQLHPGFAELDMSSMSIDSELAILERSKKQNTSEEFRRCDLILGHSIGEYAALAVAGVLAVADTLWLVAKRARCFEASFQNGEYGMLSLSVTSDEILVLLRDHGLCNTCNIACFNGNTSHVVGGPMMHLRKLENCEKLGASSLEKAYASGLSVDWPEFYGPFTGESRFLDLLTFAFGLKTFWQPYTTATSITEAFTLGIPDNPGSHEAVAEVKPTATPEQEKGAFTPTPCHNDSLVHIGDFALNIKLSYDGMDTFYFCSGIGSITPPTNRVRTNYRSYSRTPRTSEGESRADIYILSENQLVGVVAGLMFPLIAEAGVDPRNIEDSTNLPELGVDSLMGIAIVRKTKSNTGQILLVSMFSELRAIRDVRERLGSVNNKISPDKGPSEFSNKIVSEAGDKVSCPQTNKFGTRYPPNLSARPEDLTARYRSNAVLLRHDAHSPTYPPILVAGSNGSASIYTQPPTLRSSTPIWVLESPFLSCPTEMAYTVEEIAPIYVAALKVIQPTDLYLLGGYSASAVHAYEIARLLLNGGEEVDRLTLVGVKAHLPGETWDEAPQMADVEMLRTVVQAEGNVRMLGIPTGRLENGGLFTTLQCMYKCPSPWSRAAGQRAAQS